MTETITMNKCCLTEKEAAEYLAVSVAYLRADRMNGKLKNRTLGPPFVKFGRSVRYLIEDLNQWLQMNRVNRVSM
jgi:excisionase family DNA binding protein